MRIHTCFSALCSPLKENKCLPFFFFLPQAPKNPSKHEFLNREGVSQLYEAEGIIKQAPPTLGESPHIKR